MPGILKSILINLNEMNRLTLFIILLFSVTILRAQRTQLEASRDSLSLLFEQLHLQDSDQAKKSMNRDIMDLFSRILADDESFNLSFDTIRRIGNLTSPDKKFRIFTWNVPMSGVTHDYHGIVQYYDKKSGICRVYELSDETSLEDGILHGEYSSGQWPGALYYEIHRNKHGGEVFYTILGFHYHDRFSDKKLMEAMYFNQEGDIVFGKPVFQTESGFQHRVLFEYSGEVVFNLRYNPDMKMIVFDHLAPIEPELAGHPRFYAPDFSYDGFRFRNGIWVYQADLDVRNRK